MHEHARRAAAKNQSINRGSRSPPGHAASIGQQQQQQQLNHTYAFRPQQQQLQQPIPLMPQPPRPSGFNFAPETLPRAGQPSVRGLGRCTDSFKE